jgi:hypothetical protein
MEYPGDQAIKDFKENGPFSWVGLYLGGPTFAGAKIAGTHQSRTWTRDAYAHIKSCGLGVLPIYAGNQNRASAEGGQTEGENDAAEAAALAEAIGIPTDAAIYLDVEGGASLAGRFMIDYILSFTRYLDDNTKYWGAVYCNHGPAIELKAAGYTGSIWLAWWDYNSGLCGSLGGKPSNCANPCQPTPNKACADGFDLQQYSGEVTCRYGGSCLQVDLSVSTTDNPGNA